MKETKSLQVAQMTEKQKVDNLVGFDVLTCPLMQPPAMIFGFEGQNSKHKMSPGLLSSNYTKKFQIFSRNIYILLVFILF